jgi:predicted nucleotidyltransferase
VLALIEQHRDDIAALCNRYRVARLAAFGSAATGTFDPVSSDLDFVVTFLPLPPIEHADAYFGLLTELERLFGRKVDLIEEDAIHNPHFRRSLEASRVPLYAA